MKKKYNILSNIYFSFIFIPILLFVSEINIFWNALDKFVFEWFFILITALFCQIILFRKKLKYSEQITNILYIVFSIIISLFLSYFIHRFFWESKTGWKWVILKSIVTTLLISIILFVIKIILWYVLVIHLKKINKFKTNLNKINLENQILKKENEKLKEKNGKF